MKFFSAAGVGCTDVCNAEDESAVTISSILILPTLCCESEVLVLSVASRSAIAVATEGGIEEEGSVRFELEVDNGDEEPV